MSTLIVRRMLVAATLVALVALGFAGAVARAAPTAQTGVVVEMRDNSFEPRTVTVPVGATVTWRSTGQRPHTATADNGSFNTGNVASGATSNAVTFSQAGTFPYYCEYHGGPNGAGMAGTIVVEAAQASPAPSPAPSVAPSPAPSPAPSVAPSPAPPGGGARPPARLPDTGANSMSGELPAAVAGLTLLVGLAISRSARRRNSVR